MAAPDFIPLDTATSAPDFIPLSAINGQQTPDFGIDFTQPRTKVREAIAALPPEQKAAATKAWAQTAVGKARDSDLLPEIPIGKLPFENEINAGVGALWNKIAGGDHGRPYDEGLTFAREARSQEKAAHPASTFGADIATGFALPMPAPAATALGRVAQGIKVGAGYGGLQGAADAEPGFENRLGGAGIGALIGGGAGGVLGIAGEKINSQLQKAQLAKFYDASTGTLTPAGEAAAKKLGIADPTQLGKDGLEKFARSYALDPKEAQALIDSGSVEHGLQGTATRGQLSKDPEQLMQEKALRSGIMGQAAKDVIVGKDAAQAAKLEELARTTIPTKIAPEAINTWGPGAPIAQDLSKTDIGATIGSGLRGAQAEAKAGERAAWQAVGPLNPTPEALQTLPNIFQEAVQQSGIKLHPDLTKASFRMAQELDAYTQGKAAPTGIKLLGETMTPPDVGTMRKNLLGMVKAAEPGADKQLAGTIYGSFNKWIDTAAQAKLLAGAPEDAARMVVARDATREMHAAFAPMAFNQKTPGGKIVDAILKTDAGTPSQVVDRLLTQTGKMQPGTIEAVRLIKDALNKYTPQEAGKTMGALKLAYWAKLVQKETGDLHTPQVMLNKIKTAFADQSGLLNALYSPSEIAEMRKFAEGLKAITWKDPNPSGTATGLAVLAKHFISKVFESFGPWGAAAMHYSGIPSAYGYTVAQKAIRAPASANPSRLPALPQGALSHGALDYITSPNREQRR